MPGTLKKSLVHILWWSGESENVSLFLNLGWETSKPFFCSALSETYWLCPCEDRPRWGLLFLTLNTETYKHLLHLPDMTW